ADFSTAVLTRIANAAKTAKLNLQDQYPGVTTEQLSALTLAFYETWQNGRTRLMSVDGIAISDETNSDQALYERYYLTPLSKYNDPANMSTLPGYLVEVGNFGQQGSGLIFNGGPAQA
ncbi:MAG: hypothetical protein P8183_17705, partial [Anaerolineae bacterium]